MVNPALIDITGHAVNAWVMDADDILPRRSDDPVVMLARQDLDPLSIEELGARIAALEAEISRVKAHRDKAGSHRNSAEALFRR